MVILNALKTESHKNLIMNQNKTNLILFKISGQNYPSYTWFLMWKSHAHALMLLRISQPYFAFRGLRNLVNENMLRVIYSGSRYIILKYVIRVWGESRDLKRVSISRKKLLPVF